MVADSWDDIPLSNHGVRFCIPAIYLKVRWKFQVIRQVAVKVFSDEYIIREVTLTSTEQNSDADTNEIEEELEEDIPVITHGKAAELLDECYDGTSSKMKPLLALFFS